jgi:hypothetical protein
VDECHEAAALRLAMWELGFLEPPIWISRKSMVIRMYEANCCMFGSCRVVEVPITAQMFLLSMARLTCKDLM